MKLRVEVVATDGRARAGLVRTLRGEFLTPAFMPVGTRGAVRAMTSDQLASLGPPVVLGNTYHLMLRPGAEVIAELGGLGRFMGLADSQHTLTDSGGFQVFSLGPRVDDDGVTFRSTYDGDTVRMTPESAVRTQEMLGADIQMVLDHCIALPASPTQVADSVDRTAAWAARARRAHTLVDRQALFGIVQGGVDVDQRRRSADLTTALDFDGYAIGGLSVGETREEMLGALDATVELLPPDQLRYVMGLGDPLGVIEAVARGVDMMDCVLPTRLARHGTLLTDGGRLSIRRAEFQRSDDPLDPHCPCSACRTTSRGYLRHLVTAREATGATLATLHNLSWMGRLLDRARAAIQIGRLDLLRDQVALAYGPGPTSV